MIGDALAPTTPPAARLPVVVAALGAADPWAADRRPDAVRRTAGRLMAGVLDGLPRVGEPRSRSTGARLWTALREDGTPPRPAQLAALEAALILMADHELAASTLAARVAASAWADPYRVVLAGLGPLGGSLHGTASVALESTLAAVDRPERAFAVAEAHLAGGAAHGFGHRVYRDRDPRADHLLARLPAAADGDAARGVLAFVEAADALGLPAPNADLGLVALAHAMRLRPGSAAAIFAVARIVGLIAHALEEYPHRLRFRPRASYVGAAT